MSRLTTSIFSLDALLLVALSPALLAAQDNMQKPSGMDNDNMGKGHAMMTVTGCLKKGSEESGYYITGQDGNIYELSSQSVNLSEHVNHTVTVAGQVAKASSQDEEKREQAEKSEASGNKYSDLQVTKLKMVSPSCTR